MTLDEYQQEALTTTSDRGTELVQRVLGLAGESGEIADRVKRWLRDGEGDLSRLDRKVMGHELGDALWYVATLADLLGYRLEDVARENLAWRAARHQRQGADGKRDPH